jgi:hypothetical protein
VIHFSRTETVDHGKETQINAEILFQKMAKEKHNYQWDTTENALAFFATYVAKSMKIKFIETNSI